MDRPGSSGGPCLSALSRIAIDADAILLAKTLRRTGLDMSHQRMEASQGGIAVYGVEC